jgi:hypothetical protein
VSWNVADADGVKTSSVRIDGVAASAIYGPYAAASGVNYSGKFAVFSAGTHSYVITATDKAGNVSTFSGSFTVGSVVTGSSTTGGGNSTKLLAAKSAVFSSTATASTSAKVAWLYGYDDLTSNSDEESNLEALLY